MARRTAPPRQPAAPPANAEEGAARIRAAVVKMFDKGDGNGANWILLLESIYQLSFSIVDERPDDDARRKLMQRIHEDAEVRLTGGYADGMGPSKAGSSAADSSRSNTAHLKPNVPRPPH
jgi:hypothetical protein